MARKDELGNKYLRIMSNVAMLEYQTVMHHIFIDIFMNQDMHLCRSNISGFKMYLQKKLLYFRKWFTAMKRRKLKDAHFTFISLQAWMNLWFTVCGFIGFAEYVLSHMDADIYIPMLLSNTSSLEALFSHICSLGSCSARSYPMRIASWNVRHAVKAIENSLSYSVEDYLPEPEIDDKHHTPGAIKELDNDIKKHKGAEWLWNFEFKLPNNITVVHTLVPQDGSHFETNLSRYICLYTMNITLVLHFMKMIAKKTFFADYYTLSPDLKKWPCLRLLQD